MRALFMQILLVLISLGIFAIVAQGARPVPELENPWKESIVMIRNINGRVSPSPPPPPKRKPSSPYPKYSIITHETPQTQWFSGRVSPSPPPPPKGKPSPPYPKYTIITHAAPQTPLFSGRVSPSPPPPPKGKPSLTNPNYSIIITHEPPQTPYLISSA